MKCTKMVQSSSSECAVFMLERLSTSTGFSLEQAGNTERLLADGGAEWVCSRAKQSLRN